MLSRHSGSICPAFVLCYLGILEAFVRLLCCVIPAFWQHLSGFCVVLSWHSGSICPAFVLCYPGIPAAFDRLLCCVILAFWKHLFGYCVVLSRYSGSICPASVLCYLGSIFLAFVLCYPSIPAAFVPLFCYKYTKYDVVFYSSK